jgi:hypothetical protein
LADYYFIEGLNFEDYFDTFSMLTLDLWLEIIIEGGVSPASNISSIFYLPPIVADDLCFPSCMPFLDLTSALFSVVT